MKTKIEALMECYQLQRQAEGLFIQAELAKSSGDYVKAEATYREYNQASRAYLQGTLDHNSLFPGSAFDVRPIAQTLINSLMVHADIVHALGNITAAETLRDEAIATSRKYLGRRGTAETERSRAGALILQGRFNEAIVALMAARDVILENRNPIELARISIDLAGILQWLGDFRRAKEEIEHAQAYVQSVSNGRPPTQMDVLTALFASIESITTGQGDSGQAVQTAELYRAAIEVVYYHGLVYRSLKQWDAAEHCFTQALPEYQRRGSAVGIEFQFAKIKAERGQFREALTLIQQIAPAFQHGALRPKAGVLQCLEAKCLHGLGQSAAALDLIAQSIADLAEKHFDPDALWRSQGLRAQICASMGERKQALQAFRDAIKTISNLRRSPLGYRLDSTFLADKQELYSQSIKEALRAEALLDCCQFMEGIKSRTLRAVLSTPPKAESSSAGLENQFEELTAQLDAREYQGYREGWTTQRRLEHRGLLQKRADILERLRISDPRWRQVTQATEVNVSNVLKQLAKRAQAALTLYYDPPELTAILLFDGKLQGSSLRISDQVAGKINDYVKYLGQAYYNYAKNDFSAFCAVLAEDLIPSHLLAQALQANSLIIVPHGLFHLVPWAGLLHGNARLFERLPVGIVPNLALLAGDPAPQTPASAALVGVTAYSGLGDLQDLPSVRDELAAVQAVYEQAAIAVSEQLLDETATETAFWNMVRRLQGRGHVLHMSCHANIVPSEPMNSGLLLVDSKVDAAELARARLPFNEVILSACNTGWRPTQVGDVALTADEILGIPAGFLESGVQAVLVSIPKAEAQAAKRLTTAYHQRRVLDDSPLRAFQSAQKQLLQEGNKPGTWVGFTLYSCG